MQIMIENRRNMRPDEDAVPVRLSRRDVQLARLVSRGQINKQIAYILGITEGTVKVYLSQLFAKLGLSNRAELSAWAVRHDEQIDHCLEAYGENRGELQLPPAATNSLARVAPGTADNHNSCHTDSGRVGSIVVCFSCGSVLRPAHHANLNSNISGYPGTEALSRPA